MPESKLTNMTNPIRHLIQFLFLSLLSFYFTSCSTVGQIKRDNKDMVLDTSNFHRLDGSYFNSIELLRNLHNREFLATNLNVESVILNVKTVTKKSIKLDFESNGKTIKTIKLYGKYKNGYFVTMPKLSISLLPLFPIFWGPGTYNLSLGLTKENNLVFLESHGGIVLLVIVPVFGGGGQSDCEIKRLN